MLTVEENIKGAVFYNIEEYFRENNMNYTTFEIFKKSNHPSDDYLFMVIAVNLETLNYAVWTMWNDDRQLLSHGHYDIESLDDCLEIIETHTYKI